MGNVTGKPEDELVDGGYYLPISKIYNKSADCDFRVVRKLITEKRLSPFYKGENAEVDSFIECPICFLYYPSNTNFSRCCKQPICTECFLQIKHPVVGGPAVCPFCVEPEYGVIYSPPSIKKQEKEKSKESEKIKSVPHTSPSVILIDTIRPSGRKPIEAPEASSSNSSRRVTISGRPTRYHSSTNHGTSSGSNSNRRSNNVSSASFTQESTISSRYRPARTRAASDLFSVEDVQSEMERLMLMEAIRLSLADQQATQSTPSPQSSSQNQSIFPDLDEEFSSQESKEESNSEPPSRSVRYDFGTSV